MRSAETRSHASTHGRVIACYGKRSLIETDSGATISCVSRGRRSGIVCGDRVRIMLVSPEEGVIEHVDPRSSLVYRQDQKREKSIAANVSQVVVVLAVVPTPNEDFIDRCLTAAEHARVRTLLVLNKIDLSEGRQRAEALLARYRALGYGTIALSARRSADALVACLRGQTSLLIGQSGVGKSTLVNLVVPQARARVGAISAPSDAGRHTTTSAQLYRVDDDSAIIDSPGMHSFGVGRLSPAELALTFIDFRPFIDRCRFNDCRHCGEPDCAVEAAVRDGIILPVRLDSFRRILATLSQASRHTRT